MLSPLHLSLLEFLFSSHVLALISRVGGPPQDKSVILMGDACEACERIFSSPVPLVYTRHTARFLSSWLLLVPFALWGQFEASWNHVGVIPASLVLAIFLFGIDELAVTLEEPFSILPLETFCGRISEVNRDLVAREEA